MKKVTKLIDKQGPAVLDYLGVNLLDGVEPKIEDANGGAIDLKRWGGDVDPYAYRLLTVPFTGDVDEHIDIFSENFTFTYDLGKSTEINGIFTSGYWHYNKGIYMIGIYEFYASDDVNNLYDEKNMILHVDNEELFSASGESLAEAYFDCQGFSGRYVGFKVLKANSMDDITRLSRIGVYSNAENEKRGFLPKIIDTKNLLTADKLELSDFSGAIDSVLNGSVMEADDSIKLSGEIVINNEALCEKLLVMGIFEKAELFASNDKESLFSSVATGDINFYDTNHDETCLVLSMAEAKKYIGIKLPENSVIEQLGIYSYVRRAYADLDNIRTEDFVGVGANELPMAWMPESRRDGFRNVYWPVYRERMAKANPAVIRLWFQIDWVVTEEEDYLQGICNFKSDKMRAFLKYMDIYEEAGIEVEFNFGWKASTEIQEWFSVPSTGPQGPGGRGKAASAPKNFEGFAKCCASTLKFLCEEKGYTCIKHLTFYNESGYGDTGEYNVSDFGGYCGQSKQMWEKMLRLVDKELKANGCDKYVDYWVSEISGPNKTEYEWIEYMMEHVPEFVATNTFHRYRLKYNTRIDFFKEILRLSGAPRAVVSEFAVYTQPMWMQSNIECVMSMLRSGLRGGLYWILQGIQATDPVWFFLGGGSDLRTFLWKAPYKEDYWTECYPFYEFSLFMQYLPRHSNVIETKIYDEDTRIEVIETASGDYSVFVESKASKCPKTIEVEFSKILGKKFQKHVYKEKDVKIDGNMTVPPVLAEIEVEGKLVDTLDCDYQLVCYTTIPSLKQIRLNERKIRLNLGESFKFEAELIDCEGEIAWEIVSSDGVKCEVSEDGLFTQDELTRPGDILCVKAYLKGDPKTHAIAMVEINK